MFPSPRPPPYPLVFALFLFKIGSLIRVHRELCFQVSIPEVRTRSDPPASRIY